MGGGTSRRARPDAAQCADVALSVDFIADGGGSGHPVLAPYGDLVNLRFIVYRQLRLAIRAYCSIQVAALADLA